MKTDFKFEFQSAELKKYSLLTFIELEALLGRVEIKSPVQFESSDFVRSISEVFGGKIEVRILEILERNSEYSDEEISNAIDTSAEDFTWPEDIDETAEVVMMESSMGPWFTIDKNNVIEWPSYETDDEN